MSSQVIGRSAEALLVTVLLEVCGVAGLVETAGWAMASDTGLAMARSRWRTLEAGLGVIGGMEKGGSAPARHWLTNRGCATPGSPRVG